MTHEELRQGYEIYALDAADAAIGKEIEAHLERGCEVCAAEVDRARRIAAALREIATRTPQIQSRILSAARLEQRRFGPAPFLAAACLLALFGAFYFSGRERDYATLAARLDRQLRAQTIETTRLNDAIVIVSGADAMASFGGGEAPKGRVFVNPLQGALLIASNLAAGKRYEIWLAPKTGSTLTAAGTFEADAGGNAMYVRNGPIDLGETRGMILKAGDLNIATVPLLH